MTDNLREATERGVVLEIPRTFQSYEVISTIGVGGYAVVVEVRDVVKNMRFAAKVIQRPPTNSNEMKLLERELRLSETISSPFLIGCIEVVYLEELIILVMERNEGIGMLKLIIENPEGVIGNWREMFRQVCQGVQYLHKKGMAHRDLKPDNVLVDKDFNCKLCDYGFLCEVDNSGLSMTKCGTMIYMSPEMCNDGTYSPLKSDIWALGLVLYTMLTGCIPWKSSSVAALRLEIMEGVKDLDAFSERPRNIMMRCCDVNPEARATIDEIMDMPGVRVLIPRQIPTVASLPAKQLRVSERRDHFSVPQLLKPRILRVPSNSLFRPTGSGLQSHGPPVLHMIPRSAPPSSILHKKLPGSRNHSDC